MAEIITSPDSVEPSTTELEFSSGAGDHLEPGGSCLVAEKGEEAAGGKGGAMPRMSYSRAEMEALRFLDDADEQRRRWKEVCERLDEVVSREYDGLRRQDPKKHQCGSTKKKKKKEAMPFVVGDSFATNITRSSDLLDFSHLASCDPDITGKINLAEGLNCDYGSMDIEDNISNGDNEPELQKPFCDYESMNNHDEMVNENQEFEEYDSSDDEYGSIQRPAFFVEGEPDFDSGLPLDGMEYLRRVRWEAAQIPKVKVAKLSLKKEITEQTPYMPSLLEIPECPSQLLPSRDWEEAFLANFNELREAFSRLETSSGAPSVAGQQGKTSSVLISSQKPKSMPTMTQIRRMDAVSRAATLRNYINILEGDTVLSRDDGLWLFALCAVVDTPLDGDTCASLRCLLRKCSSILSEKSELDDDAAMLNILIAIAGKYFGQSERK